MKKRTLTIALVLCMVALLGLTTLAYFQDYNSVTNYFAVAGVDDPTNPNATIDPNELFSIKLDEALHGGEEGQRTEEGNTYENILPGTVLAKDPTVTNTGKYDAWIRVKVTVTDAADWQAVCAKHNITNLTDIFGGHDETAWTRGAVEADTTNNTLTYTYYLNAKLAPVAKATLFETVSIPTVFDVEDMAKLATFQLQITAEAIQVDNTGATAQEAFGKWDPSLPPVTETTAPVEPDPNA